MEWTDLPKSDLAQLLKSKKLEHPTSAAFDAAAWREAAARLDDRSQRDTDLAIAAIYYGSEIGGLRERMIPLIVAGMNRPQLVRVLVAFANQQYLTLLHKVITRTKANRRSGAIYEVERSQQQFVGNTGGQEMNADDLTTFLVDGMPHWLFHIWRVADDAPSTETGSIVQYAALASEIVSIEHSLRGLWLNALWCGNALTREGDALVDAPRDQAMAEHWFIWDLRQRMLYGFEQSVDQGAGIVAGGKLPRIEPAIPRTVIRIEHPRGGHRRFILGQASGVKLEQRSHVSERDMLEAQYTGLFLDETLPNSPGGDLTCRELNSAWWILQDLAHITARDLGKALLPDNRAVSSFALTVERKDLAEVLSDCMSIDSERAESIIDWLTCDPSNTSRIFAKSFWSEPLVPEPDTSRRHIMMAPLLVGAPVKRIEDWLERGGITDNGGLKGRGKPFERHVRSALAEALVGNTLLDDTMVAEHGVKRKGDSEEIDLLVRIGDTVIVGEVKCFVAPSEPLERHNHLDNLSEATRQAAAKRIWAEANRTAIGAMVGVTDADRLAALSFQPLVVLNNGMGIGLERNGVPIVDLHYLSLLLGSGNYQSGARFERGVGMTAEYTALYGSGSDLEARMGELLRAPPPLQRFEGNLRWRRVNFPTASRRPFFIELPALAEDLTPNLLRDLPYRGTKSRRR